MKRIPLLLVCAAAALAADLPVKEVVLYKHGIGFFERSGRLDPGQPARLDFEASEMNDILKSLTILERGGGKVSGIRYDSFDPLSHKLAGFPFQLGDSQPLTSVLDQLKGARIELRFGSETLTGTIVGARLAPGGEKQPDREQVVLLLDSGELRVVDLGAAAGLRFTDPKLQSQFKDYLEALIGARSKDRRSVYIDSVETRARELVVGYISPSAIWKSSYRLIFGATGAPSLEGWAVVDNTTGEDWTNIQLSLVSGRPISFVSELYAPKYLNRPKAELAEDGAAQPVIHAGAYEADEGRAKAVGGVVGGIPGGRGGRVDVSASAAFMSANDARDAAVPAPRFEVAPSSIAAAAEARDLGELFEYRIGRPVSIRKNESAMLPFLQQDMTARKLLIYSNRGSQHPTNAAELTNSTGKTLDGGPITVYDAGVYGGEALMETLKSGDKRLISYGVDLGTRITQAFGSKAAVVREIHANRGILRTRMAAEETATYTIRNVDQKAKTLILEHPLRPQYTLLNQKPAEKTPSAYRFEIALAAGATQEFAVSEERVYEQSYTVASLTPDVILSYVQNRSLSDAARKQLQQIADQKKLIAGNERNQSDIRTQITESNADQERLRQNVRSLNSVSGQQQLVQNYARQIDAHEQQLAALRDRQAELQKQKAALQTELENLLDALTF